MRRSASKEVWAGSFGGSIVKAARLTALIVLMAFCATAAAVGQPLAQRMLPVKDSVKGFSVVSGSLVYGKGDDISKIYNGGYKLYTDNGVIDAARQMYQRKNDYVEVTVHTMKSEKAALDFLKYWQKEHKVSKLTTTRTSTSFTVTRPTVMVYWVTGRYFTTVAAFYSSDTAVKEAGAFASFVEKQALKLAKSAGSG